MRIAFKYWLIAIAAAAIAFTPGQVQAQSGLRTVGPVITKHSMQRTIDAVRSGLKQGAGPIVKVAPKKEAKVLEKNSPASSIKPVTVGDK